MGFCVRAFHVLENTFPTCKETGFYLICAPATAPP